MAYKTPGVYVEEISTLPPSVAEVSTAIPAFIGYTEKGSGQVARINSLLEYETIFGKAKPSTFTATVRGDVEDGTAELVLRRNITNCNFLMYYSVSLYFKNGGGSCYIVSIGSYDNGKKSSDFVDGLAKLKKEDEPTLILLTDATTLSETDYYELCQDALRQCNDLGDRFAILDVLMLKLGSDADRFRSRIGTEHLKYGAAYYPYLQTSLNYSYKEEDVKVYQPGSCDSKQAVTTWTGAGVFDSNGIFVNYSGDSTPKVNITPGEVEAQIEFKIGGPADGTIELAIDNISGKTGSAVVAAWTAWKEGEPGDVPNDGASSTGTNDPQGFEITSNNGGTSEVPQEESKQSRQPHPYLGVFTLADIKNCNTSLYNQIKTELAEQRVVLPPSPAIAGVYASIDRDRGVWKAPANVGLAAVIGPVSKITNQAQENLNVDPTSGKSINVIRAFTGKGTLVWGARTLAGNDNEWRYISVRRLFIMIEESTQKATAFAVFEPNDATTWLKVKAMIESYLYGLWEQGALAGPTPEAAYFVNVGLGKTMTSQDVLEGLMNVEIGVAAVRPAEFIILKFTHKLQEA